MKRFLACLTALVLALACFAALAEDGETYLTMVVVNCDEWVSLRSGPSTSADRIAQVPLGEVVFECSRIDDRFFYCTYMGQRGYILADYLMPTEYGEPEEPDASDVVLDYRENGLHVLAERAGLGDGEYLLVTCEDESGDQRWFYETMTDYVTELTLTDAFIGGAVQDPFVMVYNTEKGLTALDLWSGEERWTLTPGQADLGASITHARADDGTLYIGGYYGPDPVAIDVRGNVLWRSDSGGCAWLYEINLGDEEIACHYDLMSDADGGGWVYFRYDGSTVDFRNYD